MTIIKNRYSYEPDYAIAPGETLLETIDELGMSQKELALRTGLTAQSINRIIRGTQPITFETSNKLELATGVPARMWNNLESQYREQLSKIEENERLEADLDWLKTIPFRELIKREVIPAEKDKKSLLRHSLAFYGVSNVEQFHAYWEGQSIAARRSQTFDSHVGPTSAWIRLGELQARDIDTRTFSKSRFKSALNEIRSLTNECPKVFVQIMRKLCADSGVAFCLVPAFPKAPWYGASLWMSPNKALILLSLRGKHDDKFWFTFFHEAAHILHDSKKDMFINDGNTDDPREQAADEFASTFLIPKIYRDRVLCLYSKSEVRVLASEIGISPGIVVGLYQHLTHKYDWFNDLKRTFVWPE